MHLLGVYSICLYSIGSSAACQQSASRVKCENCETQRKRGEQESSRGHKFSILENVVPFRDCTSATLPRFEVFLLGRACPRPCWKRVQQTGTCRGKAPPSCYARPFCRLKSPPGTSLLRYASKTRTFENTLISAACKKTQGKLWQKERGPDGASPLDRIMRCSKISAAFIAFFKNSAEQNGIFTICSLRILLRWENRIRQKDKVSAGKIRTRQ